MDLLTISRVKAARSCLRYHKLRFLDGVKPVKEDEARRFGTLVHIGLEAWWRARMAGADAPHIDYALEAMQAVTPAPDPFELAKAEVLLIGYDGVYCSDLYEVLAVEVEFRGDLVNPQTGARSKSWVQGGKIDAVVRDLRDGRVLTVEHKTSSEDIRQGSEYWRRLRMDGQISTYFDGARMLGFDPAGCLYDVIGKPGLRPHKATPPEARKYTKATAKEPSRLYAGQREHDETVQEYRHRLSLAILADPTAYFQRGEVARLESELDEHRTDTWQFAQALRSMMTAGRAPRNPDACTKWNRTCEMFAICTGETSADDPLRYRRAEIFPELTQIRTEGEAA